MTDTQYIRQLVGMGREALQVMDIPPTSREVLTVGRTVYMYTTETSVYIEHDDNGRIFRLDLDTLEPELHSGGHIVKKETGEIIDIEPEKLNSCAKYVLETLVNQR